MTTTDSAREILEHVGGAQNVAALQHCSTRLRFSLVDDKLADEAALKAIPGVIGVVKGPQTQIVVGTKVAEFYGELEKLRGPGCCPRPPSAPYLEACRRDHRRLHRQRLRPHRAGYCRRRYLQVAARAACGRRLDE